MSLLSTILSKILGRPAAAEAAPVPATAEAAAIPAAVTPGATTPGVAAPATAPVVAMEPVDVNAKLAAMATSAGQPLNWKVSIVDLMKLLGMDSSLAARKQLAEELNYTGDMQDSGQMNVWLHKQVMQKLAANGGQLPPDLAD